MTNYFVRESDGRSMRPVAWGGPNSLLVVVKEGQDFLPYDQSELIVIHKMHANKSEPMEWSEESHVFVCKHCKTNVNMSDAMFNKIQENFSIDSYASFGSDGVGIEYGFLLADFAAVVFRHGVYVVAYESVKP